MSDHGRGTPLSEGETKFLMLLCSALAAEGVREMDIGPRSHEAFEILRCLGSLRYDDFRFHSAAELAENFLLFNACSLRAADWIDNTMILYMTSRNQMRVLCEDGAERSFYVELAQALMSEFPQLVKVHG